MIDLGILKIGFNEFETMEYNLSVLYELQLFIENGVQIVDEIQYIYIYIYIYMRTAY